MGQHAKSNLNRQQLLDLYFLDARCKLVETAAFLDRLDRAEGDADFRLIAFGKALEQLRSGTGSRVERVLSTLSDPTIEPIPVATAKGASGAWQPAVK